MFKRIILRLGLIVGLGALVFSINARSADADLAIGIIRPVNGSTLNGPISVRANTEDPNFLAWQVDLIPIKDPKNVMFVWRGETRNSMTGQITRMDTGLYPNGDYNLRVREIKKDGNYIEYFSQVTIDNDPTVSNGIKGVLNGVKLGCLQTIRGIAHSDNFLKFQLDLLVNGDENQVIQLQRGSQPHWSEGDLAQVDTTKLPDGNHMLRLRVVRNDGNYDTYYAQILIDNSIMKDAVSANSCTCAAPDPNISTAQPNGITNPSNATNVAGTIPVCGNADDQMLLAWQVDLLFDGDPNKSVVVAHGESDNLNRNPFTLLDTTNLPDGRYGLRLTVARTNNTYWMHTIDVCVQNHAAVPQSGASNCAASGVGANSGQSIKGTIVDTQTQSAEESNDDESENGSD